MDNINPLENPNQKSNIQTLQSITKQLGIDKITNKKLKRFVVNTIVALSFLYSNPSAVLADDFRNCVVTNSNSTGVNIRNGPSTSNLIIGSLSPDEVAEYDYSQDDWNLVYDGDVTGWVSGELTTIKNCTVAEEMIEGLNDNTGVVLPYREYPNDNIIIFGTQEVLTDDQVIELHRFIGNKIGETYVGDCEQTRPILIVFVNVKQLHQLQRGLGRLDFHSFQGIVDFDGTTLTASEYCNSNSYTAAVINVEEAFPLQSLEATTANVIAHEDSHIWRTKDKLDHNVYQNAPLQLDSSYYWGALAAAAFEDRCLFYTNSETIDLCNELGEIVRES